LCTDSCLNSISCRRSGYRPCRSGLPSCAQSHALGRPARTARSRSACTARAGRKALRVWSRRPCSKRRCESSASRGCARPVLFRLAGDHAAVTADATVQVDRHAPGVAVALIFVIEILIQREFVKFFLLRLPFLRQLIFLVLEFFERAFAENVAAIHREVRLRRSYDETTAGLADDRAAADPRRVRKANVVSVEAAVRQRSIRISLILILGADAAGFESSVAEMDCDHVIGLTRQNPNGNLLGDRAIAMRQLDRIDDCLAAALPLFIIRRQATHLLRRRG